MVEINNLTTTPIREELVRRTAELLLKKERKLKKELSIAFVGQKRMRRLNKMYRGKDKSTDVLAFSPGNRERFYGEQKNAGEIIISVQDLKKNAKDFDVPFEQELLRIIVHGILHLAGYDHEKTQKEAKIMFKKQNYYFQLVTKKK